VVTCFPSSLPSLVNFIYQVISLLIFLSLFVPCVFATSLIPPFSPSCLDGSRSPMCLIICSFIAGCIGSCIYRFHFRFVYLSRPTWRSLSLSPSKLSSCFPSSCFLILYPYRSQYHPTFLLPLQCHSPYGFVLHQPFLHLRHKPSASSSLSKVDRGKLIQLFFYSWLTLLVTFTPLPISEFVLQVLPFVIFHPSN